MMKVISYGSNYEIYEDNLKTFDALPAATYKVSFNPMSGFSLAMVDDFKQTEDKIYGEHLEKIDKVLQSYDRFNRSLGVILSGDKGMGKSLFVQLLSRAAIAKGMPVILVTDAYPGVGDFIERINQEVLVIFDEFEKVFPRNSDGGGESQNKLLGLFDGVSQKKRIYAITVNEIHHLSEFMISRTGRFHYHIRFDYPTPNEIDTYLRDKVEEEYYDQIKPVISFANRVKLNYDSLRAIAFEINGGHTFNKAIGDLNILSTDRQYYNVDIKFNNGQSHRLESLPINLFAESARFEGYMDGLGYFNAIFDPSKLENTAYGLVLSGEHATLVPGDYDDDLESDIKISSIIVSLVKDKALNFKF